MRAGIVVIVEVPVVLVAAGGMPHASISSSWRRLQSTRVGIVLVLVLTAAVAGRARWYHRRCRGAGGAGGSGGGTPRMCPHATRTRHARIDP
jgi:hypothetical protein